MITLKIIPWFTNNHVQSRWTATEIQRLNPSRFVYGFARTDGLKPEQLIPWDLSMTYFILIFS